MNTMQLIFYTAVSKISCIVLVLEVVTLPHCTKELLASAYHKPVGRMSRPIAATG